jgi:hypothetical protein
MMIRRYTLGMLVGDLVAFIETQGPASAELACLLTRLEHAPRNLEVILRDEYGALYELLGVDDHGQLRENEIMDLPANAIVVRIG